MLHDVIHRIATGDHILITRENSSVVAGLPLAFTAVLSVFEVRDEPRSCDLMEFPQDGVQIVLRICVERSTLMKRERNTQPSLYQVEMRLRWQHMAP